MFRFAVFSWHQVRRSLLTRCSLCEREHPKQVTLLSNKNCARGAKQIKQEKTAFLGVVFGSPTQSPKTASQQSPFLGCGLVRCSRETATTQKERGLGLSSNRLELTQGGQLNDKIQRNQYKKQTLGFGLMVTDTRVWCFHARPTSTESTQRFHVGAPCCLPLIFFQRLFFRRFFCQIFDLVGRLPSHPIEAFP